MKLVDNLRKYEVTKPILKELGNMQTKYYKREKFSKELLSVPTKTSGPDGFIEIFYCIFD